MVWKPLVLAQNDGKAGLADITVLILVPRRRR